MEKLKVYILQHSRKTNEEENVKTIGIYSSKKKAEEAKKRMKKLKGFKRYPRGFSIDPYVLDQDYWEEGFITVYS